MAAKYQSSCLAFLAGCKPELEAFRFHIVLREILSHQNCHIDAEPGRPRPKGPNHPFFKAPKAWARAGARACPGVIFTIQYNGQTIYRRRLSEDWKP